MGILDIRHRVAEIAQQLFQESIVTPIGRGRTFDRRDIARFLEIEILDRSDDAPFVEIDLDRLLPAFSLTRTDLVNPQSEGKVAAAVRALAARMPAYITLKDVKKRWGKGHEDIFPVAQFEKLWGDMTALPELDCRFVAVPRNRGQQLKEPAQLDGWLRDGSAAYLESLGDW